MKKSEELKVKNEEYANVKGITIVALVITIIVMLILVGVGVKLVTDGKLIGIAENTVNRTNNKVGQQQGTVDNLMEELEIVELNQIKEATSGKRAHKNLPYYSNGKTAIIPAGFTVSGVSTESTIDGGLVIYLIDDKTNEEIEAIDWTDGEVVRELQQAYDQFVWIPVTDINDMYMCQNKGTESYTGECTIKIDGTTNVATCTAHGNCTAMAGYLYTDKEMTTKVSSYTSSRRFREPDITTGSAGTSYDAATSDGKLTNLEPIQTILGITYEDVDNFKDDLQKEYNNIVKSICENKGFYVGRYETSNITKTATDVIGVKAGKTPANNINWYYMYAQQRSYTNANKKNLSSVGSAMIQATAYYQVMKFVDTETYNVTEVGNVAHSSSEGISKVYQTGGLNYPETATVEYKDYSKNIFDLEGNVYTLTLAALWTDRRACFGGTYGIGNCAAYRTYNGTPNSGYQNVGTLCMLYLK